MDIEAALGQHFLVFPCQADAFVRQKERGNGARVFTFESPKFRPGTSHAASPGYDPYLGSRKFLATSVQKFWHWYKQCSVPRHFYELIKEGTPCRPYFDLEYYRKFNEHLDAHETLFAFLRLCRAVFADELGVMLTDRSFLLLDSSTDAKFSVHVTVHLPDGKLFTNNVILKALIDRICARMTEEGVGIVRYVHFLSTVIGNWRVSAIIRYSALKARTRSCAIPACTRRTGISDCISPQNVERRQPCGLRTMAIFTVSEHKANFYEDVHV